MFMWSFGPLVEACMIKGSFGEQIRRGEFMNLEGGSFGLCTRYVRLA